MNGYNFTDRVRKVLQMAREEAARLHHEYVGTEHILLGLIREGEGVAAAVLTNLNVDLEEIQQKIEETVKKGKAAAAAGPDLPYTSRAKKVLELAMSEARELNHSYVGTEHLLLGLLREEKGIAAQVLTDAGVNLEQARAETLRLLGSEMPSASAPGGSGPQPSAPKSEKKSKTPALDHFCRDLTQLAAEGDHQRDRAEQEHHPLHRRAAHAGGRGRGGGGGGRLQHAEAGARPRRAAVRRGVDPQRVPQVHREGRGTGAALPNGDRRPADGGRDDRNPEGAAQALRGAPSDRHPRRYARGGGAALGALHHGPVPAGQGDRRDRRGRGAGAARRPGAAARSGGPQGEAREGEPGEGRRGARPEFRARGRAARSGARAPERDPAAAGAEGEGARHAPAHDQRGRRRVHRVPVDGDPGDAAPGGGDGPAAAPGRRDAQDRGGPGRGDRGDLAGHPAQPRRAQGSQTPDRLIRLQRAHGGGEDRAGARAGTVPFRRHERPHQIGRAHV